jgi:hypothetical protein
MARPDGKHKSEVSSLAPVTRREIAFAAWVLTASLLLASVPVLIGWLVRPPNSFFWGVPAQANYLDANQYLALTRQALDSGLLVGDPYTTEPHDRRLFIPHVVLQAVLCRAFAWHPLIAYHVCRVLFGAMLLAVGAWLGFLVLNDPRARRLYLLLLGFSTGAGWILQCLGVSIANGDLLQPEGNTFHTLVNLPHLSLSAALLTFLVGAALKWLDLDASLRPRWATSIFAAAFALSWSHPFDFATLGLILACYAAYLSARHRSFPARLLSYGFIAALGAMPAAVYLTWLTAWDPVYRELASDRLHVQGFWYYAIAQGPLLLAGLPALFQSRKRRELAPALCWVVPVFVFLMVPLALGGKQCRLVGGIHVPLALLAAGGIAVLLEGKSFGRRVAGWATVAALCLGSVGVIQANSIPYLRRGFDYYWQPEIRLLFQTLRENATPGDVLLGGPYTGSWAPVEARVRSFHGHWHMTLNETEKRQERDRFFTAPQTPEVRAEWLRKCGIRWIVHFPAEWSTGTRSPAVVPGVKSVFVSQSAILFRFEPP